MKALRDASSLDSSGQVWDDLVGQHRVVEALKQAASGHGMSHAWLFTGPPGSGRSNAAIAFAAALQCERAPDDAGCGECHQCHTVLAGSHADVTKVTTEMLSIGVKSMRELVLRAALMPVGHGSQVIIIEDADRLTEQACNALLKAIEEPTARTVWMLCAPTVEDVLPTIRSRCRLVTLATPTTADVAGFLVRADGVPESLASYAARASQGHIGRARALARDESTRNRRREVVSYPAKLTSLGACMTAAANLAEVTKEEADLVTSELDAKEKRDLDAAYGVVERGRRPREYAPALSALEKGQRTRAKRRHLDMVDRGLMDLVSVYRDAIAVATGATGMLVNEEIRGDVEVVARTATPEVNLQRIGAIFAAREQMLEFNVPVALALEAMMVALKTPDRSQLKFTPVRAVAMLLVVLLIVGVGGLAIGLALDQGDDAGSGQKETATLAPTPTPQPGSSEPPVADLASFYAQQLTWEPCRGDFECATLSVPIDYADPGGETIDLALLKDPADEPDQRVGSLVVNPGGPGAPGTSYAENSSFAFRDVLRNAFDIVGFDPRGTGESDPVDCISDQELDDFLAADPDPDTPQEGADYQAGLESFYQGCVDNSDSLIGHVTTIETARDMDVLRAALGESKILYFGASYGTKLGATYADLFPDRVGRMVLDGAVDLSIDSRQLSLEQAGGFEVALRSYVQNCVDEGDCFLGDTVDEGLTTIQDLIASIDEEPLPATGSDRELAVGNAFYGLVAPLYNREYWSILDQALQLALDGDGILLLRLSDLYESRNDEGSYDDNSAEAIYAINCLDDPYAITADQVPAQLADFEEASPTFGDVFAWGLVGCHGIQVKSTEPARTVKAAGAAPIVVVGTTRDPATPYQWAVHLADQLESGVLVSRDGDGHTGYNSGNNCVDEAIEGYLVDGTVPEDGLEC